MSHEVVDQHDSPGGENDAAQHRPVEHHERPAALQAGRLAALLDERTAALAGRRPLDQGPAAEMRPLLICRIDHALIALPFEMVAGVHDALEVVAVPSHHEAVLGIASIKGSIFNVIDLACLLGIRNSVRTLPQKTFLVVLRSAPGSLALLVDEVNEVVTIDPASMSSADTNRPVTRGIEGYIASGGAGYQTAVIDLEMLIGTLITQNATIGAGPK